MIAALGFFVATVSGFAQESPQNPPPPPPDQQAMSANSKITIPAGTMIALVLTQPVQSRVMRRGDDIYAQVTAPVTTGNAMVIPPGTFVQGTFEKVDQRDGRGELHLAALSITFPDGYVAPISGPVTLESSSGYAIKDPGGKRSAAAFVMPVAGAGIGALIGHSVGTADSNITTPFPPGCSGPPPYCTTTSMPVLGTKGKDTMIGASIGAGIGAIASVTMLFSSRHFFLDVGTPIEMTLEHPVSLEQAEVAKAVEHSGQPVAMQPIAPRPLPPPYSTSVDHGTCFTPGTPGTPPTVIPGAPGADGIPGPPTIIPGTPPTPGTPYPCP